MAGRRKGPCEFCDGTHDTEYKTMRNGFCIWLEVYPENNNLSFIAQSNDENGDMQEDYSADELLPSMWVEMGGLTWDRLPDR